LSCLNRDGNVREDDEEADLTVLAEDDERAVPEEDVSRELEGYCLMRSLEFTLASEDDSSLLWRSTPFVDSCLAAPPDVCVRDG